MSTEHYLSDSGAFVSLSSVACVVPEFLPSFRPFSNSVFALPRFRANFGIAAPPKRDDGNDDDHDNEIRP